LNKKYTQLQNNSALEVHVQ